MIDSNKTESQGDDQKKDEQHSENTAERIGNEDSSNDKKDTFSRDYVETLRRENAQRRTENKQLRDEMQKITIRSELKTAAMSAGIVDLDALRMFDISKVTISADGDVVGVNELITDMQARKPYLFSKSSDVKTTSQNDQKIDVKTKTSSDAKAPEKTPPKSKTAKDFSTEEFETFKRNGFKGLPI